RLHSVRAVRVECPVAANAAIITFNKAGWDAADIRVAMAEKDITVQVSTIFHTRLDYAARGIQSAVRVSPHYYNTSAELDQFLTAVEDL
ncbi:MAG: aminotransferase class V-fold PLP-dependent enzyme, partial [Kordiimonadaceae bacterium]|nr:aminotransferase class V-fold PLP-dependent enzyme [Kordiimonadaceae bacterium]